MSLHGCKHIPPVYSHADMRFISRSTGKNRVLHHRERKLRQWEKFATVLQLEPLHTCNLTCTGLWAHSRILHLDQRPSCLLGRFCLGAAEECDAGR